MKRILTTLSQKWPEYLLEMLVITFGIVGAFMLNGWNEDRKDVKRENQILGQLMEDYEANLVQLENKMAMRNSIIKAGLSILNDFDRPEEVNRDSLISNLSILIFDPTFDPIQNDLISSGNIRLIRSDKLRRLLSNWSSDIIALQEVEVLWSKAANEELNPLLSRSGLARDVNNIFGSNNHEDWHLEGASSERVPYGNSKNAPKTSEIVSNIELEGMASFAINLNRAANEQSVALRKRIQEILNLLEQEIQR